MHDFFTSLYQQFLSTTFAEWVATVSGFLCVFLAARRHILNWPISIISVSVYAFIFLDSKLYGDALLQLYFVATAFYGWYYWNKTDDTSQHKPVVSFRSGQQLLVLIAVGLLTLLMGTALDKFTDSDVPYIDGFCTAMSFVAQFLMARRVLQSWLLWVIVDICYIPLYLHKDLVLTAILYVAFTIIAWNGYRDWRHAYLNKTR